MRPVAYRDPRRGQSTLEYAVIIAVVVAALLAMQIYMKRGVQGKLHQAADDVGAQYVPAKTTSDYTVHSDTTRHETTAGGASKGETTSRLTADEEQTRFGSETVDTTGETKLFSE